MNAAPPSAAEITRASKSNLALAFVALPPERREDITTFYAWCRVIDDIADDPGQPESDRRAALDVWRRAVCEPASGEPALAKSVRALMAKYALPVAHFHEIIAGVEMDVDRVTYETWDDLRLYCHRVASVVGLVSVEIFGARDPACRQYALDLGLGLQITNILRDVGQDFSNDGRIYLPRAEMERFHYTPADLAAHRRNDAFLALMESAAQRALSYFRAAAAGLPRAERRTMIAAEIMRSIYSTLLAKMRRGGFRVFDRRYRLTRWTKASLVAWQLARVKFDRTSPACATSESGDNSTLP